MPLAERRTAMVVTPDVLAGYDVLAACSNDRSAPALASYQREFSPIKITPRVTARVLSAATMPTLPFQHPFAGAVYPSRPV